MCTVVETFINSLFHRNSIEFQSDNNSFETYDLLLSWRLIANNSDWFNRKKNCDVNIAIEFPGR